MDYTYQNYHRHSMYTNVKVPDSVVSIQQYADRAKELGQSILSTVEHGWQGNVWESYKAAKESGLKLLVGAEAYWVKDRFEKDKTNCHICVLAKNENGRQALNDVLSEANITGFYNRARLDIPLLLSLPADDIWVTSACLAGWLYEDADDCWYQIAQHFGKNFFLEVQYHNTDTQMALNSRILKLRDKWKVPLIMGCDSHYIHADDAQNRTDFLVSKGINYPEEEGWYLDMPDGETAYQRFAQQGILSHEHIIEAISNTNVFADVEEYDSPIFNTDIKMPSLYPDWTQEQKDAEYQRLVWAGWDEYKSQVPEDKHELYRSEIQKEIQVVIDTKMADYFIDNYHIIRKGKENGGWLTKTGRGSAVSFLTNKLLGFTEVDRLAASVKMYPERFMSTERILQAGTLPDIDFNVAPVEPFARGQQEVMGENHAYPMIAYGTLQKSAAWKLYAKSQGVPFEIANAVSDQLKKYEVALKHADEDSKDEIDVLDYIDPQYHEIFLKSKDYLGLISSWSIAPCSYLLYQGNIRREIGLVKIKDHLCCLMDGHWAESAHFLKNDLLKVSLVDIVYRAYKRAGMEPPGVQTLLEWCSQDTLAWDLYKNGCTLCLNQVEKTGTSARVGKYSPKNISELCAFVAAIRPGFKSMYKTFESRVPFSYGVKAFDDLIQTPEMPNSFVLYQEQEMAALNYAGIPMSDCYTAIKNIAKKRKEKVLAYGEKFRCGIIRTMVEDERRSQTDAETMAAQLWQIITDAASYSFNASHSYCVALDSLYEAWIKSHFPLEFYETALKVYDEKGDKDKMSALKAEAESYFNIKFPPFRYGMDNRSIIADKEHNAILNSITAIKGFGVGIGKTLYQCAVELGENPAFIDVLSWLDKKSLKSSKVIPLIKIDYFQEFGNETELLRIVDLFDFFQQGTAKTIKKDKLKEPLYSMVAKYATDKGVKGNELKSFTITDMNGLLHEVESYIRELHLPDLTYKVKAENQKEILGYVDLTTGKEEDRRKLFVLDVYEIQNKWSGKGGVWKVRVQTKSLGSGKTANLSIAPYLASQKPVHEGDILVNPIVKKDSKGYWNLLDYDIYV